MSFIPACGSITEIAGGQSLFQLQAADRQQTDTCMESFCYTDVIYYVTLIAFRCAHYAGKI